MARINIEDCWWTDPRRESLGFKLQSMYQADAVMIRVWRLAQEFWKNEQGLIPIHIWEKIENHPSVVQAGLAVVQENGVYVRGSSLYLDWIREQKDQAKKNGSKGGKISAQRPRDEKGRLKKVVENDENIQAESKRPLDNSPSAPSESKLSGSYSYSFSSSLKENTILPKNKFSGEIQKIYKEFYPRKVGGTKGVTRLSKEIKTESELALLESAVKKYSAHLASESTEKKFIKHFSTFAGEWRDWLEPDAGMTTLDGSNASEDKWANFLKTASDVS